MKYHSTYTHENWPSWKFAYDFNGDKYVLISDVRVARKAENSHFWKVPDCDDPRALKKVEAFVADIETATEKRRKALMAQDEALEASRKEQIRRLFDLDSIYL